jgi:hypothetical protein
MNEQTPTNRPAIDSAVYDFAPGTRRLTTFKN